MILGIPAGLRGGVLLLEQQPLVAFAALGSDDGELAGELFAGEAKLEIAARKLFFGGRVAQQLIRAAIPQHHAAGAVVAFGDYAFEAAVFDRVILHHHGEALFGGIERGAFGNGPRFQRAVDFQAEIVMQMGGVMALDAKLSARRMVTCACDGAGSGVSLEMALFGVRFERQSGPPSDMFACGEACAI